ncbi:MAG: PqqD family protein [Victivallales bacterium]|jgi:hypothetical protein|nr:PqqD family protein [Victivallales bacterium]MBR4221918.1 PqqD family protein [Victivallales bacterium]
MALFGKQEQATIDRREALASIPALVPGVTLEEGDDGRVTAVVTSRRPDGFWARFMSRTMTKRVRLDEIGTYVIRQIDGVRTVKDLVEAFASAYRVNRREAELCMAEFLKSLVQRNIIAIGIR